MIKVLIVDDHAIVLEGLKRIIEFEKDISVPWMARNANETLKIVSTQKPDVIILDISMEGRSGLDIIKDIKTALPEVKIIMLSMYQEERFAVRSFKLGAAGYLTKEMASEEIIYAIRKVYAGGKYISQRFAEKLIDEINQPHEKQPHESLSEREYEVLVYLASGKSISVIAKDLSLSDRTVSTYRHRILEKMNLKNTAELIRYAVNAKLTPRI
ncbi:MAG: response regulator transcription factor [Bacteroidota bacterium]|nr:response regulator transcription factor [Bacteroidota bacterium]